MTETTTKEGIRYAYRNNDYLMSNVVTIGNIVNVYFRQSNFWDFQSQNEELFMQNQDPSQAYLMDGVSFILSMAQPMGEPKILGDSLKDPGNLGRDITQGLAIIDKVEKRGSERTIIAKYFYFRGTIVQAPDLLSFLSSKLRSVIYHFREALKEANSVFEWTLDSGYKRKIASNESETSFVFSKAELGALNEQVTEEAAIQADLLNSLLADVIY